MPENENAEPATDLLPADRRREIARLYFAGTPADELAQRYGVQPMAVWRAAIAAYDRPSAREELISLEYGRLRALDEHAAQIEHETFLATNNSGVVYTEETNPFDGTTAKVPVVDRSANLSTIDLRRKLSGEARKLLGIDAPSKQEVSVGNLIEWAEPVSEPTPPILDESTVDAEIVDEVSEHDDTHQDSA